MSPSPTIKSTEWWASCLLKTHFKAFLLAADFPASVWTLLRTQCCWNMGIMKYVSIYKIQQKHLSWETNWAWCKFWIPNKTRTQENKEQDVFNKTLKKCIYEKQSSSNACIWKTAWHLEDWRASCVNIWLGGKNTVDCLLTVLMTDYSTVLLPVVLYSPSFSWSLQSIVYKTQTPVRK